MPEIFQRIQSKIIYSFFWFRLIRSSKLIEPTNRSAIIFAPHQDDETFCCGGTIALKRASRTPVKVVYVTGGQNGQKTQEGQEPIPGQTLAEIRKKEALAALDTLGVPPQEVTFLNYMDGGLRRIDAECQREIVTKLVQLLADFQPAEVYVTYRSDVHTDHEVTYRLVREAIREVGSQADVFEYPIWSLEKGRFNFNQPEFKSLCRLPVGNARAKKLQAITCFPSQYEPIGGLTETFIKRLSSPYEFFFKN